MASLTQWTWLRTNSRRYWRTGKPGVLKSVGSIVSDIDWATEQQKIGMSQVELVVKASACHCKRWKRLGFHPWAGKIPWRREWQLAPGFLPGNSLDSGAWWATVHGITESDRTEHTDTLVKHLFTQQQTNLKSSNLSKRVRKKSVQQTKGWEPFRGKG